MKVEVKFEEGEEEPFSFSAQLSPRFFNFLRMSINI
jgi:hypothetical protein